MKPSHTIIGGERLSMRCTHCGQWPETVHLTGSDAEIQAWCGECCPCRPVPPVERVGVVVGVVGEQGGLFG